MHTGADLLVECLYRHGVRRVFGMPGSHSTSIYDALARHPGIDTILCRNEQAGAYMADGYSRATGLPGVICTTAGPGATNALTGIAEAFSDSVPILLIAGHVQQDRIAESCGRYHEIDLDRIFAPCTRFARTVMSNEEIPGLVTCAFQAMISTRPGPAALFFPQDLMAIAAPEAPPMAAARLKRSASIDAHALESACDLLRNSDRPVILAGGGAVTSKAGPEIETLAGKLGCPVTTTLNGKGIVDERHPLSLGHGRTRRARVALSRADAMLAIGCRFTEMFTGGGAMAVPRKLIQIDIDAEQIGVNYPPAVGIRGDARTVLRALSRALEPRPSGWKEFFSHASRAGQLKPEWLIETLRSGIPDDTLVFADACEIGLRMKTDFPTYAQRTFLYPSNYASLGWGFPAAIGGAVAQPDRWTVCVAGDGGFQMSIQELATAVRYDLKLITVVHNDSAYGAIKLIQRTKHKARFIDSDLNNPDFVKLGESFGVPSERAADSGAFADALKTALKRDGPSLIEVPDAWRSVRV